MVASLMVIGAAPASAAVDTSDSCPVTTPSSGFTDIGGFDATTQRAIDCLVSYGISNGTSATTYSPNAEVTRWQMALFLTRQAGVHGVSLPSGAPQGFTDIAGLNASTQVAINQLAQLEITQGTSATTFSPNEPVTRWQMALFITRLATAAGLVLPSGAPQGFTDLGGLSNEAQIAINQLAQLDIADGTSATTFSPMANVNRWQMALFLTRTLAVDGITPTKALVSIAPADAVTLNAGQARTYTATFQNANGSPYVGAIGIRILDTTAGGAPVYQTVDDNNTNFEAITDGLASGDEVATGFPGANGQVTFTVRNTNAENIVVVAWQDTNANGNYGAGTTPDEPFAVTAVQTFSAVAPAAAVNGTYAGMVASSSIKASDTFVAAVAGVNCGNGVAAACTFTYDANDIFQIGAVAATLAEFEAALSNTDVLTITGYSATAAGQSTFNITTDNVAPLTVTTPSGAVTVDAATYTISGAADPGAAVRVYADLNNDGDKLDVGETTSLISATASADGAYSATVNLTQNAANDFLVAQVPVGGVEGAVVNVPTITDGTNAAATITGTVGANGGAAVAGTLDPTDTITITFSENITGVGTGDTITIVDTDGSTATLTLGPNVGFVAGANNIALTINAVVSASGGTTGGIQTPATITAASGFTGADGLPINVAGSGGAARTFSS